MKFDLHTTSPQFFARMGTTVYPTYAIDVAGRLAFCGTGFRSNTAPTGVSLVAPVPDSLPCRPWEVTLEGFGSVIEEALDFLPTGLRDAARKAYPGGKPPHLKYLVLPAGTTEPDDKAISEVIRVIEKLGEENPLAREAEDRLAKMGVYRIPPMEAFAPTYHVCATAVSPETPVRTVRAGWARQGHVYSKSEVEVAL